MEHGSLIARLQVLGITTLDAPLVALLPLVQVAWADGVIDANERRYIGAVAQRMGIDSPGALATLDAWLMVRPLHRVYVLGREVLAGLALDPTDSRIDLGHFDLLPDLCLGVARVSHGDGEISQRAGLRDALDGLVRARATAEQLQGQARPRHLPLARLDTSG